MYLVWKLLLAFDSRLFLDHYAVYSPWDQSSKKRTIKKRLATNWFFGSLAEWNNCENNQVNPKLNGFGFHVKIKNESFKCVKYSWNN